MFLESAAKYFVVFCAWLAIPIALAAVPLDVAVAGNGKIVVANRGSDTISVIDAGTDVVIATVPLPMFSGDLLPQPMYVVNTPAKNRVWVGDRANNRVVVFDGNNFEVEATVPCGNGIFHMWADQAGRQLWVVNDVDKTATVIDVKKLNVLATVPMPSDLGAPHDVVLDTQGVFAYVTFLADNTVVQFDTYAFSEVDRAVVGISPHVAYVSKNDALYLPCQGSSAVYVLDAVDLTLLKVISVPNAHGAIESTNSQQFYTTNIAGGGTAAIQYIDTKSNTVVGVANTILPTPHNLAITPDGKKLYVTHSGASANKVSVFATKKNANPVLLGTITVGTNPFGLAYVR